MVSISIHFHINNKFLGTHQSQSFHNQLNIDHLIIDGMVRAVGSVSLSAGNKLRVVQNGYVRSYALLMVVGALALIATIWLVTAWVY